MLIAQVFDETAHLDPAVTLSALHNSESAVIFLVSCDQLKADLFKPAAPKLAGLLGHFINNLLQSLTSVHSQGLSAHRARQSLNSERYIALVAHGMVLMVGAIEDRRVCDGFQAYGAFQSLQQPGWDR